MKKTHLGELDEDELGDGQVQDAEGEGHLIDAPVRNVCICVLGWEGVLVP